jgi:phosphotriesterase-related protein
MRVQALKLLMDTGREKQLLVSTDICHKNLLHRFGGWGYDHILTNIVSMMQEHGINRAQINLLLRENPARFLCVGGE